MACVLGHQCISGRPARLSQWVEVRDPGLRAEIGLLPSRHHLHVLGHRAHRPRSRWQHRDVRERDPPRPVEPAQEDISILGLYLQRSCLHSGAVAVHTRSLVLANIVHQLRSCRWRLSCCPGDHQHRSHGKSRHRGFGVPGAVQQHPLRHADAIRHREDDGHLQHGDLVQTSDFLAGARCCGFHLRRRLRDLHRGEKRMAPLGASTSRVRRPGLGH
mmetsp:Transcript_65490/g.188765  ORF Transcript_65490/g.188765 Transcript_65490/m.188765 type:complete len:216 (+) Transcript_65490:893-1540(+)